MVDIHPLRIEGRFSVGVALDHHTTSSTPIGHNEYGHMQFDTVRPEIAELLYQLKYKGDRTALAEIVTTASTFLRPFQARFNVLVPVPPSTVRSFQPVMAMAHGIAQALNIPIIDCVATTRAATQLKGVTDPEKRAELVDGLYTVPGGCVSHRKVLLFDDLFRSGTTMNAITDVLRSEGKASDVIAVTITKTRNG